MDELDEIQKAIIKKLLPWFVVGGVAVGGLGGSGILRIDKFGKSDFDREMNTFRNEAEFSNQMLEIQIRRDMPPMCTRKRILNIEKYLEHKFPDFERSEFCW